MNNFVMRNESFYNRYVQIVFRHLFYGIFELFQSKAGHGKTISVAPACATNFKFAGVETSGTRRTPSFINVLFEIILGCEVSGNKVQ